MRHQLLRSGLVLLMLLALASARAASAPQAPIIQVEPPALDLTTPAGRTVSADLTLRNVGDQELTWQAALPATSPPGLLAYWHFDEGSGQTTQDFGPYNLTTQLGNGPNPDVNDPLWTTEGRFGSALAFTPPQRVRVIQQTPTQLTDRLTLAAWVHPTKIAAGGILSKGFSTNGDYALLLGDTLRLQVRFNPPAGGDRATGKGAFYIDGALVSDFSWAGPITTSTENIFIGAHFWSGSFFTGMIDEPVIFDRALSAQEVLPLAHGVLPAVPYWASALPDSGAVLPGGQQALTLTADAADLIPGVYTTTLEISSNDPDRPLVDVPITLTAGAAVTDYVDLLGPRNLLSNGGFEEGEGQKPLNWKVQGPGAEAGACDTAIAPGQREWITGGVPGVETHTGQRSLHLKNSWTIKGDSCISSWLQTTTWPVDNTKRYAFGLWYKTAGNVPPHGVWLSITAYRANGSKLPSAYNQDLFLPPSEDWREFRTMLFPDRYTKDGAPLPDVSVAGYRFSLRLNQTDGEVWFDDIGLVELTPAEVEAVSPIGKFQPPPLTPGARPAFAPGPFIRLEQDESGAWWFVDTDGSAYWETAVNAVVWDPPFNPCHYETMLARGFTEDTYRAQSRLRVGELRFSAGYGLTTGQDDDWHSFTLWINGAFSGNPDDAWRLQDAQDNLIGSRNKMFADPYVQEWRDYASTAITFLIKDYFEGSDFWSPNNYWNPELVGYYTDNEMAYKDLPYYIWNPGGAGPEFIGYLLGGTAYFPTGKYASLNELNAAWNSQYYTYNFASRDQITARKEEILPRGLDDPVWADMRDFTNQMALEYVRYTTGLIRAHESAIYLTHYPGTPEDQIPHHLLFSNRFLAGVYPNDIWEDAYEVLSHVPFGQYYDVIAFNDYPTDSRDHPRPDLMRIAYQTFYQTQAAQGYPRPVIITEFASGARDAFWGDPADGHPLENDQKFVLKTVETQAQRGDTYVSYINTWANLPWMVGADWWKWVNQPFDGADDPNACLYDPFVDPDWEARNSGVVDDVDNLYYGLARGMLDANVDLSRAARSGAFSLDDIDLARGFAEPPGTPLSLTVYYSAPDIYLAWDPSPESDVAGYLVYREEGNLITLLTQQGVHQTSYTEPAAQCYGCTYRVAAYDLSTNTSRWSDPVPPSDLPPPPSPFGPPQANLSALALTLQAGLDQILTVPLTLTNTGGDRLSFSLDLSSFQPSGIVGDWPMDDGEEEIVSDQGPYAIGGFFGCCNGADENDPLWETGLFGYALHFVDNDRVRLADYPAAHLPDAITLAGWVKLDDYSTGSVVNKGGVDTGNADWALWDDYGHIAAGFNELSGGPHFIGQSVAPLNTWTHWAVTWSAASSLVRLYVNGELDGMGTFAGPIVPSTDREFFGQHLPGAAIESFHGYLDEAVLLNRPLTVDEIRELMAGTHPQDFEWLDAPVRAGNLLPGAALDLALQVDATRFLPGSYLGALDLNSNDPQNPLITVPVTLTVVDANPPDLLYAPESFTLALDPGQAITLPLSLTNAGGGLLDYGLTSDAVIPSNLVGYWRLDEGTGQTTQDAGPYNLITQLGNGPNPDANDPDWVPGKYGNALLFGPPSDRVRIIQQPPTQLTDKITIAAWIYPDTAVTGGILSKGFDTNGDYSLLRTAAGNLSAAFNQQAGGPTFDSAGTVPLNRWSHVAVTWEAASGEGRFYINGLPDSTFTWAGPITTSGDNLFLGADFYDANEYFRGVIDEPILYARALGPEEIAAVAAGQPPFDIFWLSTARPFGTLSGSETTVLDLLFDARQLANGLYTGDLTLTTSDPDRPVVAVPLSLQVGPPATETPTPTDTATLTPTDTATPTATRTPTRTP
ncbi:MAG: hypothetical protein HY784_17260, partial [Chloroflexi bacterium]|nr:hypothetical protein [Chloroflexota bacterium]